MNVQAWSPLYLDYITHLGKVGDYRRASVNCTGKMWQLSKWYKGCGFNPETVSFTTIEEAKQAGEDWVEFGR